MPLVRLDSIFQYTSPTLDLEDPVPSRYPSYPTQGLVKESAEFPCNNETLNTCRLNTILVVLNFFQASWFKKGKLQSLNARGYA